MSCRRFSPIPAILAMAGAWFRPAVLVMAGSALTSAAQAGEPTAAELGRKTYTSYCVRCHGINLMVGTGAFDLRRFPPEDKERFVRSVSKGVRAMPAWEGTVKPEEIDAIWAYIGSVNGWVITEAAK